MTSCRIYKYKASEERRITERERTRKWVDIAEFVRLTLMVVVFVPGTLTYISQWLV